MRHERATEEVRELAALYALGALTQHEARSFETHMQEGCPVCEEELHRFEHAAAGIGFATEEAEVPEYVRDLLSARIDREPQVPSAEAMPADKQKTETLARKLPPQPSREIIAPARSQRHGILPWILAAIFALLAALSFYSWKTTQGANSQLQTQMAAAQTAASRLSRQLDDVQQKESGDFEKFMDMAGKQGMRIARLKGQPATPGNTGTIFWDTKRSQCVVAGSFAPAPQGKAYQLWFTTPTGKISIGLLPLDASGRIFTTLSAPPNVEAAAGAIVTIEPAPGSQVPTGPFCATGHFD